ncbi:MAG: hypothetical protein HKN04_07685 [Rhodothermaceae bacterium]|nr:hypothetical protein [Rhodothermaceae bacterium]
MTIRRLLPLAVGIFAFLLAACDFAGSPEGATGRWIGVAEFEADTILADHNVRFVATYQTTFTFNLADDEGLITGTLSAKTLGTRATTEAGQATETITFDDQPALINDVFGTFVDPELEIDVPDGPYEANLWTFDVSGRRADLDRFVTHTHVVPLADGSSFTLTLRSSDAFEMERVAENAAAE